MDKATALNAIDRFRSALADEAIRATQMILYGSFARGNWQEWSDIDLVVVSPDFEGRGYWDRIDILVEAIYKVREPIEAVAMTPEEWEKGDSLIAQYARQGELVYGE